MPYPMYRKISFSTAAGGGVHGKAAGTAPATTTEAGLITDTLRRFIETFIPAGEMITAITGGEDMNGNISGCRIGTFSAIGEAGKETSIGKGRTPGVLRACLPEAKERSILRDLKAALAQAPARDIIPPAMDQEDK